jgi:integrase
MAKTKPLKLSAFLMKLELSGEEDLSPINVQKLYEAQYPNLPKKDSSAYRKALIRAGLNGQKRQEHVQTVRQKQAELDILQYPQVQDYVSNAEMGGVQQSQITGQCDNLRKIWELMDKTDPNTWRLPDLLKAIEEKGEYKKTLNENGQLVWEKPSAVKSLLSPVSTMWKGKLPNNWSANLCIHKAGELKDFFQFYELDEFLSKLSDNEGMNLEGWQAAYRCHVSMGCREGTNGKTGILGLLWEDINFQTRRCSLREKGHRGNAGERWNEVPLDMFPFLHSWDWLLKYWKLQGCPKNGKVFKVSYSQYNKKFHETRKKCQCRISEDNDTMRLHIFRRTHGQYCRRIGIPLEYICGDAPFGRYGVGWKDPKIPVRYYLTQESDLMDEKEIAFMQANSEYHTVLATMKESIEKQKKWLGA